MGGLLPLYVFFGTLMLGATWVPIKLIQMAWAEKPTGRHLHH